jgi:hypothetical protein
LQFPQRIGHGRAIVYGRNLPASLRAAALINAGLARKPDKALKLLDIDSSLTARKALAQELFCPDELMNDSAKMNMWLHRNVLAHVAANGGNIPKELLD